MMKYYRAVEMNTVHCTHNVEESRIEMLSARKEVTEK